MNSNKELPFVFDGNAPSHYHEFLTIICRSLKADADEIGDIQPLTSGMTNRSFLFSCRGERYIFRVPGEGTDKLINRNNEYRVYQQIKGKSICDELIYFDPNTGYKITKFVKNSHKCDPCNPEDVQRCIRFLRQFHRLGLRVENTFDIFGEIERYERLLDAPPSFADYSNVRKHVFSLKQYIDAQPKSQCLSHIDSVPDNFLITDERVYLIDWEYAAMQDPHIDIAMFAIYSLYDRSAIDRLIDLYFENRCPKETRIKIYCYIAACGLLWSVWCEYKAELGVTFDEYALAQYHYAKTFCRIVAEEQKNE